MTTQANPLQDKKRASNQSILRVEGIALLVLTATVYSAFLVREMGYADQFDIPHDLIVTSHIGLLSAAKAIVWGAMVYVGKVNLVWILTPRKHALGFHLLRYAIGFGLIVGFAMFPYLATDLSLWWFLGVVLFLAFFWFGWPLITQRKVKGYENKLVEQVRIETAWNDIYGDVLSRVDRSTHILLIVVAAIMVFAYGDGRRNALEQEDFDVVGQDSNTIVLRIYGEIVVMAALDAATHQLSGLLTVQKLSEERGIEIRRTKLGRLKRMELRSFQIEKELKSLGQAMGD
jgi:hypothetical protein